MENSKFNINRPPLNDDEINEAKNFEEVINQFGASKKTSFYKKVAVGTGIVALLTVGAVLMVGQPDNSAKKEKQESTVIKNAPDTSVFSKPISGLDVPYVTFKLDPTKRNQFTLSSGTIIDIPETAFLDENGKPITDEIELKFREFHDVVSIFAAGIPMTYDSAGTQYHFESAGMFEILAYDNGQPVKSNSQSLIKVTLASFQQGDNFNLYYLENNTTWNFIKKDTAKGLIDLNKVDSAVAGNIGSTTKKGSETSKKLADATKKYKEALQKAKIIEPQLANNNLYSFMVDFEATAFPELAPYKNVLFEITENNKDFNPNQAKKDWFDIQLTKTDEPQIYKTIFSGANQEKMTLFVRPVFSSKDVKSAEKTFEKLFVEYDKKNQDKLTNLRNEKQEAYQLMVAEENVVKSEVAALNAANELASKAYESQSIVKRVFEVENFGMWNSDCPQSLPKGEEFEPLFVNEKKVEDTLTFTTLFMAELNKNALYTLYGSWGNFQGNTAGYYDDMEQFIPQNGFITKAIGFNNKNKTVLWGITKKNELAILRPVKMEKIKGQKPVLTIQMEIIASIPKDIPTLKKTLGF
jgi:hypothetical protein